MIHIASIRGLGSRSARASTSLLALLALLALAPIACRGASEPIGLATSIVLISEVPSGVLNSRDDIRVYIGERLGERRGEPIIVQARDPRGRPVPGVEVKATASHSGLVAAFGADDDSVSTSAVTSATGTASFWWTPGPAFGFQTLTLSAPGSDDLVIRVFAYWPSGMTVNVILADSVLSVGESTTAHATFTTAAGEVIAYDGKVRWHATEPRIAAVSGGDAPATTGFIDATGAITVTAASAGRTDISAGVTDVVRIGSQSMISGRSRIAVQPICTLDQATPLVIGQPASGLLTELDCTLPTGAPYDTYRLTMPIGQRVQVDLASTGYYADRYDPYLILLDANGNWVTGDDWSGGGTSPRITFTAEATTYYLQATSLAPGITGTYTLTATVVP